MQVQDMAIIITLEMNSAMCLMKDLPEIHRVLFWRHLRIGEPWSGLVSLGQWMPGFMIKRVSALTGTCGPCFPPVPALSKVSRCGYSLWVLPVPKHWVNPIPGATDPQQSLNHYVQNPVLRLVVLWISAVSLWWDKDVLIWSSLLCCSL